MKQDYEEFLKLRKIEPPDPDLAKRITAEAAHLPQIIQDRLPKNTLGTWLRELWSPKPAFALACLLIIGFTVGFFTNPNSENGSQDTELASLLYNDEEILWVTNSN